jgi:protein-histidine pros-kinase
MDTSYEILKDSLSLILGSMVEAIPDASLIVNEQGKILFVNHQVQELFGYEREELLELIVEQLIPERFRNKHTQERKNFALNPRTRPMGIGLELYALKKNGTEFSVEISLSPLEIWNDLYVVAAIRDISIRKTEQNFNALFEAIPFGLLLINQCGSIILVNHAAVNIFGFQLHQAIDKKIWELIPEPFIIDNFINKQLNPLFNKFIRCKGIHKDNLNISIKIFFTSFTLHNESFILLIVSKI